MMETEPMQMNEQQRYIHSIGYLMMCQGCDIHKNIIISFWHVDSSLEQSVMLRT